MILFYFTEAFRIFRKSGYGSFVLIFVTSLAAIVSTCSILIILGVNSLDENLKSGIKLNIFLKSNSTQEQIDKVKSKLHQMKVIDKVLFITKEEATKKFIAETGEDFKLVLDENPLPNSFLVTLNIEKVDEKKIVGIVEDIKTNDGIEEVIYDNVFTLKILSLLKLVQYFFNPLSIILVVLSLYLVYSNNKLQIKQNKNLFNTMKLVGGKASSIRIPLLLYGFFVGILSSIICCLVVTLILFLLTRFINNIKLTHYFLPIYFLISVISISLGVLGSCLSSRVILPETKS